MDGELEKQLHDHDLRLTRVEAELQGVHKEIREQRVEIREQREDIRQNAEIARSVRTEVSLLSMTIGELVGTNKMLIWGLGLFGALIGGLEAWSVFQ